MSPPNGMARVFIGSRRDGAGIEDDEVGRSAIFRGLEPARGEHGFERGAIGLGGAATEILNEKTAQIPV